MGVFNMFLVWVLVVWADTLGAQTIEEPMRSSICTAHAQCPQPPIKFIVHSLLNHCSTAAQPLLNRCSKVLPAGDRLVNTRQTQIPEPRVQLCSNVPEVSGCVKDGVLRVRVGRPNYCSWGRGRKQGWVLSAHTTSSHVSTVGTA